MAQPNLTPVDFDPFASPIPTPTAKAPSSGYSLQPVDHDPFATASPQDTGSGPLVVTVAPNRQPGMGQAPTGFASRAEREGSDLQMRDSEYLADAVRMRQQQDQASPMGRLDAYARGVAGWVPGMDKLAAAGDAALGAGRGANFGDRYDDNLARQRALDAADAALNPGSRFAGQAAGLGATAAILPAANIVKEGVRGATTANAALTGGLYGALTGAVESDGNLADKAAAAGYQGATGLAVGGAAPTVIAGVSKAAGGLAAAASRLSAPFRAAINPEGEATRRVLGALSRDGVTDPAAALSDMQRYGAPAVLGDVGGETTRALARSAANQSPEGRAALTGAVSDRFAGQGDRITDLLRSFGPSSAGKTLDDLQAAARAANRPAYGKAYLLGGQGVWSNELEGLAQAPAVQDAIRSVIKTGANKTVADGMPPVRNPFTTDAAGNLTLARRADGSVATPNLQFWDYVTRELRGKAGEAARAGNKDLAGDFTNLRRQILGHLDEAVPAFKDARSGAAQAFQAEDALEAGQKFVTSRMSNDQARKAVSGMKPAEQELFAEGFRSDLIAKIRETGDGRDIVKAIFGTPAARERVEIALGKAQSIQLEAALKTEAAMLRLQEAVKGNSTTARQLAEMGMGATAGYYQGGDLRSAALGALAARAAGAGFKAGSARIHERLAKEIGEALASGDPAKLATTVKAAARSPAAMRFLEDIADQAGKVTGLSGGPLDVSVRPRAGASYMPAAADQDQR